MCTHHVNEPVQNLETYSSAQHIHSCTVHLDVLYALCINDGTYMYMYSALLNALSVHASMLAISRYYLTHSMWIALLLAHILLCTMYLCTRLCCYVNWTSIPSCCVLLCKHRHMLYMLPTISLSNSIVHTHTHTHTHS